MKKNLFVSIVMTATILIMISDAQSFNIDGWWKVNMTIEHSDFVTGHWDTVRAVGASAAYLYLTDVNEYTYNGMARLILPKGDGTWYNTLQCPGYYTVYMRNGIVVIFTQSGLYYSSEGELVATGSTFILRAYGTTSATQLKGYYLEYDIEKEGTPEQFIRMSNFTAMPVNPEMIPEAVLNAFECN